MWNGVGWNQAAWNGAGLIASGGLGPTRLVSVRRTLGPEPAGVGYASIPRRLAAEPLVSVPRTLPGEPYPGGTTRLD